MVYMHVKSFTVTVTSRKCVCHCMWEVWPTAHMTGLCLHSLPAQAL